MDTHFSPDEMHTLVRAYSTMTSEQLSTVKQQLESFDTNPLLVLRHQFLLALIENLLDWRLMCCTPLPNITVK